MRNVRDVSSHQESLPARAPDPAGCFRSGAFTLLEVNVCLAVLAMGLLSLEGLMIQQSRQVTHIERRSPAERTCYVLPQADVWMRLLGAPASLEDSPGQAPWSPPVTGRGTHQVTLVSYVRSLDQPEASATAAWPDPNSPQGGP